MKKKQIFYFSNGQEISGNDDKMLSLCASFDLSDHGPDAGSPFSGRLKHRASTQGCDRIVIAEFRSENSHHSPGVRLNNNSFDFCNLKSTFLDLGQISESSFKANEIKMLQEISFF